MKLSIKIMGKERNYIKKERHEVRALIMKKIF